MQSQALGTITDRGASLVAISVDPEAERQGLTTRLRLTFPILQDASMAITDAYGVREMGKDHPGPAVFVLDADHRVAFVHAGRNAADRPSIGDIVASLGD